MKRPKILIIGHARHGKDTVAELLNEMYGMTFTSSSIKAAEIFLFDLMKDEYGYKDVQECFEDRLNHREFWFDKICEFNAEEPARLAQQVLADSDCYVGMRSKVEVDRCVELELFDLIIWVDASERCSPESIESNNVTKEDAHIIIENNGTLEELRNRVRVIGKLLFG
jgi:dephospho-CoA kinase